MFPQHPHPLLAPPSRLSCSHGRPWSHPSCDSRLVAAVSPGPSGVAEKAIPTGTMQALGAGGRGAGGTCLDSAGVMMGAGGVQPQ